MEVVLRIIPLLSISACHAQIVVSDGATAIISGALEGRERLLVVSLCLSQRPLNVGENSQVLLRATAQVWVGAPQLEGPLESFARGFDRPTLEIKSAQSVECLRGQDCVAELDCESMTALAEFASQDWLVALVVQNSYPAQRLGQDRAVRTLLGSIDGGGIAQQCLRYTTAPLMGASFP